MSKSICAALFLAAGIAAHSPALAGSALDTDAARAAVEPFYQALNAGTDVDALMARSLATQWTSCNSNATPCAPREKVIGAIKGFHQAIPDLTWEIKALMVSGNHVIVRGQAAGTPAGEFFGVPHGGKSFEIMSIDIHEIENGKMVRSHHIEDWAGAIRQLRAK